MRLLSASVFAWPAGAVRYPWGHGPSLLVLRLILYILFSRLLSAQNAIKGFYYTLHVLVLATVVLEGAPTNPPCPHHL